MNLQASKMDKTHKILLLDLSLKKSRSSILFAIVPNCRCSSPIKMTTTDSCILGVWETLETACTLKNKLALGWGLHCISATCGPEHTISDWSCWQRQHSYRCFKSYAIIHVFLYLFRCVIISRTYPGFQLSTLFGPGKFLDIDIRAFFVNNVISCNGNNLF